MAMKRAVLLLAVPLASCFVQPYTPGAGGLCISVVASPLRPRHTSRLQAGDAGGGGLFAGLFGKNKKPVTQEGETKDKKPVKSEPKRTIGGGASPWNSKAPKGAKSSFFARNVKKDEGS